MQPALYSWPEAEGAGKLKIIVSLFGALGRTWQARRCCSPPPPAPDQEHSASCKPLLQYRGISWWSTMAMGTAHQARN